MTTPREQLALMLQEELPCWLIVYPTQPEPTTACDEHGVLSENQCPEALRIADAIIQAGWTAPPTPAHNRDHAGICKKCGTGLTALDIVDGEKPCTYLDN